MPDAKEERNNSQDESPTQNPIPIPTSSSGLTTFAYQLALANRFPISHINPSGKYDPDQYTPTFIHDIMMFPGSLASLMDKPNPYSLLKRLTPAILPNFRARTDLISLEPCIVPCSNDDDKDAAKFVRGILILGEGSDGRKIIDHHYRKKGSRKEKVEVQIDVEVRRGDGRELKRVGLMANVWVWKEGKGRECRFGEKGEEKEWTLEAYVEGKLRVEFGEEEEVNSSFWIEKVGDEDKKLP